ncbi:hypothetical protein HN425_02505 [Candidatus Woesearchaeota archaeon]|jgi:hemerythrin|nr:hypothetical protein [Candidatus Woesearchaeota archaeon]MBT7706393.1 hypothetical protein [archaeon]
MNHLEWTEKLSVGIPVIDEQHKKLLEITNKAEEKETLGTLNELIEFVRVHFTTEEEILGEEGWPDLEEHQEIHKEITLDILGFMNSFEEKTESEKETFLDKFAGGLLNHLIVEDHKYAIYIEGKHHEKE